MSWVGYCHGCHRDDREVETRYEHSAKTLCDECAEAPPMRLKTSPVYDSDTLSAPSREASETLVVEPSCQPQPQPQEQPQPQGPAVREAETLTLAENASVGGTTEKSPQQHFGSRYFEALETDALKFGVQPIALRLPDDLPAVQHAVAKDVAYVAGVYAVHDGPGTAIPYSYRWRTEVLGLSRESIGNALRGLVKRGVLKDAGETKPEHGYPRGTKLYLPGRLTPAQHE